jgi:general stress protein YciG
MATNSNRGGTHEQHVQAGRKGGEASHAGKEAQGGKSAGAPNRGGTHEQHVEAGRKGGEASHGRKN